MYRELLYQELRDQPEHLLPPESLSILDELEELADSPEQQARYLLTKIELLLTYGDYERLWQATERFAQIGLHIPMSHRDEPGYLKTSSSWMPGIYSRLMKQMTPQEKQTLLKQIEANWLTKLDTLTTPQLYTFLDALSGRESDQEFLPLSASSCLTGTDSEFDHAATQICAIRDVITIELVGRAIKQKQLQKAELLLLDLRKSTTAQTQSLALQGLSNLYSQLGHYVQAGRCLQEMSCLPTDHSEQATNHELTRLLTYLTPGMQGVSETIKTVSNVPPPGNSSWLASEEYLALFDQNHPSWQAYRQQTQTEPPLRQVTIRTGQFDFEMSDPYARRRPLHTFQQQGLMLLQQVDLSRSINHSSSPDKTSTNHSTRSEEQHLLLLDRQTGTILNRIALPGTRIGISNSVSKQVGHLFPVTVEGHILGISLLEGRPIWERQGAFLEAIEASPDCQWKLHSDQIVRPVPDNRLASPQSRRIELGPVGSGYCVFQTARALVCLDPLTGSLLWKRTDLDPQGGLWSDRSSGLIGDDKVLVYFHADQNSYTLLDTQSGALLRRDQLEHTPVQVQRTRQVFGRNLMYMTVTTIAPQERRLRLWDPLSNSFDLDVKFESRDLYHASEEELTVFLSEGRLLIYQPQEKKTIADLTLAEEPLRRANYLRVLKHGNRFLVNLYQTQRVDGEQGYTSRYTDTPWNLTHINGPILSIDATDGSLEWTRTFPNRSIVEDLHADLPFLLMCANYQTRPGDQDRQLLLEAVDPQTGKTIQLRNNLSSARLLLLNHDHAQKIIRLTGLEEEILLDYGAEKISSRE